MNTAREQKKTEILNATFECIFEEGIAETSFRKIADKIGARQSLIHYYFETREKLLTDFIRHLFSNITRTLTKTVMAVNTPEEKLETFLSEAHKHLKDDVEEAVVFMECWSLCMKNKALQKIANSLYMKNRRLIETMIREGHDKEVFNDVDPEVMSVSIISFLEGVRLQRMIFGRKMNIDKHFSCWADDLRKSLLKHHILAKKGEAS